MTVSLPMCAIDFTNDAMGPEEAAIADRIAELKEAMGDDLRALISMQLINLRAGHYISDYDMHIANILSRVVCGPEGSKFGDNISEGVYLAAERENFLKLAADPLTQARIEHMMLTGKALRN